jgi:hypothetical protein
MTDFFPNLELVTPHPLGVGFDTRDDQDIVTVTSGLRANLADLEMIKVFDCCGRAVLSGGVRWGELAQNYSAVRTEPDRTDTDEMYVAHRFEGVGPTIALEGTMPIGRRGCLALFGSTRGSLLFGRREFDGRTTLRNPIQLRSYTEGEAVNHDLLPILELEIGGEFSRQIGHLRFIARTAFVGHVWFGGDSASRAANVVSVNDVLPDAGTLEESNMGFLGLMTTFGVQL